MPRPTIPAVTADQLPESLHSCNDNTTLYYAGVRLNDAQFLLPENAVLRVDYDDGSESENRTVFSACHEFLGKSKLSFDTPIPSQPEASQRSAPQPLALPAALHFTLALTTSIDTATAAAGDAISAKLTTPIREKGGGVLVPKGAVVNGRIVQIVRLYVAHALIVAIRLETIESDGVPQPFPARLANVVKELNDSVPPPGFRVGRELGSFDQMPELDAPTVGILRLENLSGNYILRRGLQLEGSTIPSQPWQ